MPVPRYVTGRAEVRDGQFWGDTVMPATGKRERRPVFFMGYGAFSKAIDHAGINLGGEALQPVSTATTVRVQDGRTLTTDGPFAETKEGLGGFYILDCKDLDEALAWAAKCPGSWYGKVEVRPVMTWEAEPEGSIEHKAVGAA